MTPRKKSILRNSSNDQAVSVASNKSSSWISRIHSKLNMTDSGTIPSLQRHDLKRVTFSVATFTTECYYGIDGNIPPSLPKCEDQRKAGSIIKELPMHYDRACQLREEQPLRSFMDILYSICRSSIKAVGALDLSGTSMTVSQVGPIADILILDISLQSLNLSHCGLGDESIRILLSSLLLKDQICTLNLSGNAFKAVGFKYIATFIHESRSIKSIDLSSSTLDKHAIQYIARALHDAPSIYHISLDHCALKTPLLEYLLCGVRQSASLKSLSLRHNKFTHNAAPWLAAMILNEEPIDTYWHQRQHNLRGLRVLDLAGNHLQFGMASFSQALCTDGPMSSLNLSDCRIDPEGCLLLLDTLLSNQHVETLDLSGNPIYKGSDVAIHALKTVLARNSTLKSLNLSNTGLDASAAIALAESLPENTTLSRLDLSQNPNITMDGVLALSVSMRLNRSITYLDINIPPHDLDDFADVQTDIVTSCTMNMKRLEQSNVYRNSNSSSSTLSSYSSSLQHEMDGSLSELEVRSAVKPDMVYKNGEAKADASQTSLAYTLEEISL